MDLGYSFSLKVVHLNNSVSISLLSPIDFANLP